MSVALPLRNAISTSHLGLVGRRLQTACYQSCTTTATTWAMGNGMDSSKPSSLSAVVSSTSQTCATGSVRKISSSAAGSSSSSPSSSSSSSSRSFQTGPTTDRKTGTTSIDRLIKPGALAFADMERDAVIDLFHQFAIPRGGKLDLQAIRELLRSIGEFPREITLQRLFNRADANGDGAIDLDEFLNSADKILCGAPARIVLVVGGPGSGKGMLCKRLQDECHVVHLSSGELLREEVARDTLLGREVKEIMTRGELVSSAVIVTLIRRRMRDHPGKRVLLDGFPRSLDNAHDLVKLCGRPELALHLVCDDTILMERIMRRGRNGLLEGDARADDNFDTALQRLRTFHRYHHSTIEWLREQKVPTVNLDCSGSAEDVWSQLMAIGRLMRPATQLRLHDESIMMDQGEEHHDPIFGASTG